jgi:hypothetical protein
LGNLGRNTEAVKCFDKALLIKPDVPNASTLRKAVLEKSKKTP